MVYTLSLTEIIPLHFSGDLNLVFGNKVKFWHTGRIQSRTEEGNVNRGNATFLCLLEWGNDSQANNGQVAQSSFTAIPVAWPDPRVFQGLGNVVGQWLLQQSGRVYSYVRWQDLNLPTNKQRRQGQDQLVSVSLSLCVVLVIWLKRRGRCFL